MDDRMDINREDLFVSTDNVDNGPESLYVQSNIDIKPPFRSRFKTWLRTVAMILVLVFVP